MITNNIIKLTIAKSNIRSLDLLKLTSSRSLPTTASTNNLYQATLHKLISPFATIKKPLAAPSQIAQPSSSFFKRVGSLTAQDLTEEKLASLQQ